MADPRRVVVLGSTGSIGTQALDVINRNANKIDGVKISLLDKDKEIAMRRRLPQGVLHNPRSDRRTTQGVFHVAEGGLPKGGGVGYEIFDKGDAFSATSFVQNVNALRALEGELARTGLPSQERLDDFFDGMARAARDRPVIFLGDFRCDPHAQTRLGDALFPRLTADGYTLAQPKGDWSYHAGHGSSGGTRDAGG